VRGFPAPLLADPKRIGHGDPFRLPDRLADSHANGVALAVCHAVADAERLGDRDALTDADAFSDAVPHGERDSEPVAVGNGYSDRDGNRVGIADSLFDGNAFAEPDSDKKPVA